jgi:hypothetical protein
MCCLAGCAARVVFERVGRATSMPTRADGRLWPLAGYQLVRVDHIDVVRLLAHARDLPTILAELD